MKVYRLMCNEELNLYLSGNIENIGRCFESKKLANNHRYKQNVKYVHFFRRIKDLELVQSKRNFENLVTFDIPMITLIISQGKGLYNYIKNGKFKQKYVKEYAVDTRFHCGSQATL